MQLRILSYASLALGVSAMVIGSSIFVFGSGATAKFFAGVIALVYDSREPLDDLTAANVDSELRFYAVFWIAYGALLVRAARNLDAHLAQMPLLIGLFFLGGVGRLISYISAGPPHLLFVVLMAVELALPPLLMLLWFGGRKQMR